ncbi:MAG: WhiB family transcriptional regulator [Bifidobacterium sp.]|nr:WhiB family transcriptional regulator [Bifidobacterium sp.]
MPDESWRDQAACRKADPEWFFPNRGDYHTIHKALAVCRSCPVVKQCALCAWNRRGSLEGYGSVWGGLYLTGRVDMDGMLETMTLNEADAKQRIQKRRKL